MENNVNTRPAGWRRFFINFSRHRSMKSLTLVFVIVFALSACLSYSGNLDMIPKVVRRHLGLVGKKFPLSISYGESGLNSALFPATWLTGEDYMLRQNNAEIYLVNVPTGTRRLLIEPQDVVTLGNIGKIFLSPDRKWILISQNMSPRFRYSSLADYSFYHLTEKKIIRLFPPDNLDDRFQHCSWMGNSSSVVFVYKNNIYFKNDVYSDSIMLTTDGKEEEIFNGVPDWVYEEEILQSGSAIYPSKDGNFLAYSKFNETPVQKYIITQFGNRDEVYDSLSSIAYPKPGTPNPTVSVHVVDLRLVRKGHTDSVRTLTLQPPDDFLNTDYYFVDASWDPSNTLLVRWINRAQNYLQTMGCHPVLSICKKLVDFKTSTWVGDEVDTPHYLGSSSYFITLRPVNQGLAGAFMHVVKVTLGGSKVYITPLTEGTWEVGKIMCSNSAKKQIYFTSNEVDSSRQHIYVLDVFTKQRTCITCKMAFRPGQLCNYVVALFSWNCRHAIFHCQGPDVPASVLWSSATGQATLMESNYELLTKLADYQIPKTVIYQVFKDDYAIPVLEYRPSDFFEGSGKKYAVLFHVYGGPDSLEVLDTFDLSWNTYLVTNFDIIVVLVDPRGTGRRGEKYREPVYRQLGVAESDDVAFVAEYLKTRNYIDPDKLSIWGWSYGGFLTITVLTRHSGVFKCGMAVCPVTDWRYYDSAYTERYMGLPTPGDNLRGYQLTSTLRGASNMTFSNFLLVHGTADDNVHYINSAHLVTALTESLVNFRMQVYTDKNHFLSGGHTRQHLHSLLTNHLTQSLGICRIDSEEGLCESI